MTFEELVEEVLTVVKRPDLQSDIESRVRAATLKMHQTDFYSKDLHEEGVNWDEGHTHQQLDVISQWPNYRAWKYFRYAEDACDVDGFFYDIITPDEILDEYGCNKTRIAYMAGRNLEVRSDINLQYALCGVYLNPKVSKGEYCSWVAELHPYAIIYEAARVQFKTIGFDEESATYRELVAEEVRNLKVNNIQDVGY